MLSIVTITTICIIGLLVFAGIFYTTMIENGWKDANDEDYYFD